LAGPHSGHLAQQFRLRHQLHKREPPPPGAALV
jgi:hypothetical protein